MLEGIREALIQTRAVKSIRGLPSRIISTRLLAALYMPLMSYTMPHRGKEERRVRSFAPLEPKKERHGGGLMGTQLRVKNPCIPSRRRIAVAVVGTHRELPVVRLLRKHRSVTSSTEEKNFDRTNEDE